MFIGILIAALLLIGTSAQAQSPCPNGAAVVSTRARAMTVDLTGCDRVMTLSYGMLTAGGASFKPAGTTPFIDSFAQSATITGGSGYPDGTYRGVALIGSAAGGRGLFAKVTISGGTVTAVDFRGTPGNAFAVGDVLATPPGATDYLCSRREDMILQLPGATCPNTGSGFSITITAVTAPRASFTDVAGNRWQYYPEPYINTAQFGGIADGSALTPTDNFDAVQSSLRYATALSPRLVSDSGGSWGGMVYLQMGTMKICGDGTRPLIVPQGVRFVGPGNEAAGLNLCEGFSPSVHGIEICDPDNWFACFNATIEYMTLYASRTAAVDPLVALVHTNAAQDSGGMHHVLLLSGSRMCAWFRKGFGGASSVELHHIRCSANSNSQMIAIGDNQSSNMNYGTTLLNIYEVVFGGPSSPPVGGGGGFIIKGGVVSIKNVYCENVSRCAEVLIASNASGSVSFDNVQAAGWFPTGPSHCVAVIMLDYGNTPGNVSVSNTLASSCGDTVQNNQSGTTVHYTNTIPPGAGMRFF